MVLVWLWYGYGMVMVWLWYGYGMVMVWLWYGYGMVMVWLLYGYGMVRNVKLFSVTCRNNPRESAIPVFSDGPRYCQSQKLNS